MVPQPRSIGDDRTVCQGADEAGGWYGRAEGGADRAAHPRWHVHRTPPHASWLNQIELYFSALAKTVIRYGDFSSRDDLISRIESYILGKNETAKPYRCTYDGTH